jgi:hypothetical protein
MRKLVLIVMFTVATIGLAWATTQPVDAWHSIFGSKENCLNWYTNNEGMTKSEANDECQKNLQH